MLHRCVKKALSGHSLGHTKGIGTLHLHTPTWLDTHLSAPRIGAGVARAELRCAGKQVGVGNDQHNICVLI